ncbi:MAG: hypothetical protein K2W92_09720 [Alphaproteobacteria bacterium]|nr:hypothetical protein [Alphaproteobacteria bacterium]
MLFSKLLSFLSLCCLLTACGFHPLYTPKECHDVFYPIKIATILDRDGQILRNYLIDRLTPEGSPAHPQYTLEIILNDATRSTGISRDETTSRMEATLTASLILKDAKTDKVLYTHTVNAVNSYSILNQNYYADLVAAVYARREAIRLLSDKITLLLTNYIDSNP